MGARPGHGNWDEQYAGDAAPPWEIGSAQPALASLADRVPIESPVLDAGCGTGELAILLAAKGHHVVGIDISARAIAGARAKAVEASLDIAFQVHDAEHLEVLEIRPRTVFDSGLLHNLDTHGRATYVAGLTAICNPGAIVYVLAVSSAAGSGWDLTPQDLRRLFSAPQWVETSITTADVLAVVDGVDLHLPSSLLTAKRAATSVPSQCSHRIPGG